MITKISSILKKKYLKRHQLTAVSILFFTVLFSACVPARVITVADVPQLVSAIEHLKAGDTIDVADGSYDLANNIAITVSGTEKEPILIRAKNRGKAVFINSSFFTLRSVSFVVVEGFTFNSKDGTAVTLESCTYCRVTRNVFRLVETGEMRWLFIRDSHKAEVPVSSHNRIDHNLFENKSFVGNMITTDGFKNDTMSQVSRYDVIDHNYFRKVGPRVQNGMETIRLGVGALAGTSGFTTVEYNLFEECDGDPEIISVKCDAKIIRYNTFRKCQGSVCLRQSSRSIIEGNFFFGEEKEGCGGVRVYRDHNKIINNYFTGLAGAGMAAAIAIPNGDHDEFKEKQAAHLRPVNNIVAFNTLAYNDRNIEIGFSHSPKANLPPRDNVVANNLIVGNVNNLIEIDTPPIGQVFEGNICCPQARAKTGVAALPKQVTEVDPKIEKKNGLWRLTADSPARHAAIGDYGFVTEDMDGQVRGAVKDVGADEFSTDKVARTPVDVSDVGPDAL